MTAPSARATRAFLIRAVRFLAAQGGVRQFLDIGVGLPAAGSANTHEVALAVSPRCRVLYMDNDPAVGSHVLARLTRGIDGAGYAEADLRRPEELLAAAAGKLDFTRPVAVMLIAVLHLISDTEDPYGIVARLMAAVPEGSYLMLCHPAPDEDPSDLRLVPNDCWFHLAPKAPGKVTRSPADAGHFMAHRRNRAFFDRRPHAPFPR